VRCRTPWAATGQPAVDDTGVVVLLLLLLLKVSGDEYEY
jgi:hypothetical protein